MQFEYDPEQLIEEVKKRPGIWDFQDPEYRAKNTRFKLWNEVVSELMQPDVKVSKSEMRELEIQLQKKWKGIRDCFQKYLNNPTKSKKPYVYSRQLQFLVKNQEWPRKEGEGEESESDDSKPLRKKQNTWRSRKKMRLMRSNDNEESSDEDNGNTYNDTQPDSRDDDMDAGRTANTSKLRTPAADDTTFAFANVDAQIGGDVQDPDRLFLLSLLPHLKSIPEEYKLNVKMDMMQVLRNANYGVVQDHKFM